MNNLFISLRMLILTTVLLGLIYPLAVTGLAQAFWPRQANGSLIKVDQKDVGSLLLAQSMTSSKYFWPRPSAVTYATVASGASNASATNKLFIEQVQDRRKQFAQAQGISESEVPAEMVYASGSGLDPHISPQSAMLQIDRIAQARGFDAVRRARLRSLVEHSTEASQLGFLGQARINVLLLNIKLNLI